MDSIQILKHNFKTVGLPDEAKEFLLAIWELFQFFDDVADGDDIDRGQLRDALKASLVTLPQNKFVQRSAAAIVPLVWVQVLKWQASDWVEREGRADERSYVWRAGYYDIFLAVADQCGCIVDSETAALPLLSYGETFAEYREEFPDA